MWARVREWLRANWMQIAVQAALIPVLTWSLNKLATFFVQPGLVRDIGFYAICVGLMALSAFLIAHLGRARIVFANVTGTRIAMSEASPLKAERPWRKWEDQLLWKFSATEVAKKTGRTLSAVYTRRYRMDGLPDGRSTRHRRSRQ